MSAPFLASAPAVASMAEGVAKDKAHGQVTMSTATAIINAWLGLVLHQYAADKTAAISTANKKGFAIRSANKARRGFSVATFSISATI